MTNTPNDKTPMAIAHQIVDKYSNYDQPSDFSCEILQTASGKVMDLEKDIEAAIAAERQKRETVEQELAEANKLRTESRSREATHLGKIASLEQELARISKELGLPPTIGPADGEISKILGQNKTLTAENERLRADIAERKSMLETLEPLYTKGCSRQFDLQERIKALEGALREAYDLLAEGLPLHGPRIDKKLSEPIGDVIDSEVLFVTVCRNAVSVLKEALASPQEKKGPDLKGLVNWAINQKNLPAEYACLINENFWNLIEFPKPGDSAGPEKKQNTLSLLCTQPGREQ